MSVHDEQRVIGLRMSHGYDDRPLEDRVIAFRRSVVSFVCDDADVPRR